MRYLLSANLALLITISSGGLTFPAAGMPTINIQQKPQNFQAAKTDWQNFRSRLGRFTAKFPGKPTVEKRGPAYFIGVKETKKYYLVTYLDAPTNRDAQLFLEDCQKFVESGGSFTVTASRAKNIQNYPGREFDLQSNAKGFLETGYAQVFTVDKRIYVLYGVDANSSGEDQKKFLSSFTLI